ncbi:uncharacterized protein LOC132744470 [Ruditapes philippinarum]|uniref:uncharacterized protein LOC132744470 n=1 Tax=Ruditapes philippinarum TaxID=129788 RepID=UPI00295BCC6D|nr:uncharacterized protein LOC132744470 [Ruditapes philippinarum]
MATSKDLISKDTECVKETAVFESDLLDELLSSQKQAAHFLELARLALRDDPFVASKVGMTANDSQDQNLTTYCLVKEYQGTALHVIHTMLPLIETGIKKKRELLVKKGLDKVMAYVDDMVVKAKETLEEYDHIAVTLALFNITPRTVNVLV